MSVGELAKEIEAAVEKVEVEKEEVVVEEVVEEVKDGKITESIDNADYAEEKEVEERELEKKSIEETTPELSNELLERAVSAGVPVADARELPPDSLERIVKAREVAFEQAAQDHPVKETETEEEETVDPFVDLPKLDPEVHDAATIAMFDKLTAIAKQQHETIQNFETRQGNAELATQEVNRRDTVQWFDGKVSELGEDFTDTLGAGGYDSLDQGSAQFAKREVLANQVSVLLAGYEATGQQAPPRDEVFDVAARLVLRDEYQQIDGKKLSGDLEKRASQHIQRAGGQKARGTKTAEEEIAAAIDAKFPVISE